MNKTLNKKLKKHLQSAFNAPSPTRKTEFLNAVNFPCATLFDFLIDQIGYIRKRVWLASLSAVVAALFGLRLFANNDAVHFIWIISSFMPFVSLVSITEIARSSAHNMTELEMACKYSFSNIVLARLGILGALNVSAFIVIISAFWNYGGFGVFRSGIYLLTPFLLTCSLSLFIMNRLRSREVVYLCGGIACFVSISNAAFAAEQTVVLSDNYFLYWVAAALIFLLLAMKETIKLIKRTEEIEWSLL